MTLETLAARIEALERQVAELERITLPPPSVTRAAGVPMTATEIDATRSERGGWNKASLAAMGVNWPPLRGWRQKLLRGEDPNT